MESKMAEDIKQTERQVENLKSIDGKLMATYMTKEDNKDPWDYTRYEKIFDTFKEFTDYTESFFKLDK